MNLSKKLQQDISTLPTTVLMHIYQAAGKELKERNAPMKKRKPKNASYGQDRLNREIDAQLKRRLAEA